MQKRIFFRYCPQDTLSAAVPCTDGEDANSQWLSASCSNQDSANPTPQCVAAAPPTIPRLSVSPGKLQLAGGVGAMLYGISVLTNLMSWLCHLLVFRFIVVRCVPVNPHCMLLSIHVLQVRLGCRAMLLSDLYSLLASCCLHAASDDVRVQDCENLARASEQSGGKEVSLRRVHCAVVCAARCWYIVPKWAFNRHFDSQARGLDPRALWS